MKTCTRTQCTKKTHTHTNPVKAEDTKLSGGVTPYSDSIVSFCRFIEQYIHQALDPTVVAVMCEKQAEAIRICERDITGATIDIMLETLLNVIESLGQKWTEACPPPLKSISPGRGHE